MSGNSVLEIKLNQLLKLELFELKVQIGWRGDPSPTRCDCPCGGIPNCPNNRRPEWILKGIDPVFNVSAVPNMEDTGKPCSKYMTRTWQSKKGEKLVKGEFSLPPAEMVKQQ